MHGIEPLWIEHHEQALLQFVSSSKECAAVRVKGGWIELMIRGGDREHFPDGVDQESKAAGGAFENDDVVAADITTFGVCILP